MIPVMDCEEAIKHVITEAVEEAGMSGLCRDGQKELALGRIMLAMPELKPGEANGRVDAVLAEMAG
jgi:hypothetical protein